MSYILLSIVTLIITAISVMIENKYPIKHLSGINMGVFIFRYIHLWIGIYLLTFLLLFDYKIDGILYLILSILVAFSSKICECCILSYCELQMYRGNMEYLVNFHPCTYVFFREYHSLSLATMGIILGVTFYYILFKINMLFIYKLFIGTIFGYMYIEHILKSNHIKYSETYLTTFL